MKAARKMDAEPTLADLRHDPKNARKHTPRNVGMIEKALGEVGAARSIVIDETNTVLAGNATIEAAAAAGLTKLHVVDADGETIVAVRRSGLTKKQKTRLALFDNRAAELAEWDVDVLGELAPDDLAGMWSDDELGDLLGADTESSDVDAEPQIDRADELREQWGVETGQLWQLGEHRLLCGDSTKAEDVARVMGGELAGICFTSPPYGQQREYRDGATEKVSDWDTLMRGVFTSVPMADDGQVLVNLGLIHRDGEWIPYWDGWIAWMREQGWRRFGWYVWDQGHGLPGDWNGRLAPSFEFVFHFNREAVAATKWVDKLPDSIEINTHGTGIRTASGEMSGVSSPEASLQLTKVPDNVWRVMRHKARNVPGHPAMFPVGLADYALRSWPGDAYEPFSGSGTTIIACEQLKRRCRAIEISPGYVAVSLERFYQATNVTPECLGT